MLEFPRELNVMRQKSFLDLLSKEGLRSCNNLNKHIEQLHNKFNYFANLINKRFYKNLFNAELRPPNSDLVDDEKRRFISESKNHFLKKYEPYLNPVEKKFDDLINSGMVSQDIRSVLLTAKHNASNTKFVLWCKISEQIENA